jgi:long-chain fatty acid transport protein
MKLKHVAALAALTVPMAAQATDGYFSHGYGMKANGRGGAAIAVTDDAFGGANNPANMVWVGRRVDVGLTWFRPDRDASRSGSAGGTGLFDFSQDGNEAQNFFIPEFGYNHMLSPDLALGVTVYGNGGMNTEYKGNVIDPGPCQGAAPTGARTANGLCGQGKLGVDLMQLMIAPTLSWKFHPNHSVGVSPLIGYQRFESYGLQPFAAISSSPGDLTNNGHDSAWGFGVRVGYHGKIAPTVSVGATWQSKIYMSEFDDYKGLFAEKGDFDIPMNWGVGIAWQAMPQLLLAADYVRIYYNDVKSVGNPSNAPGCTPTFPAGPGVGGGCLGAGGSSIGFGWQDVNVFKLGAEYRLNPAWLLRAGYNYTDNPIKSRDVTFNILAPGVVENHLTLGFTYTLAGGSELTAMYFHAFENDTTGPANNPYFPVGGTEKIKMSQDGLGIAWGMKW